MWASSREGIRCLLFLCEPFLLSLLSFVSFVIFVVPLTHPARTR